MEYCCHVWACAPSCYLQMLEKLQKWICRTVGPSLAVSLELFGHFLNVASFSLFYKAIATYFFVGRQINHNDPKMQGLAIFKIKNIDHQIIIIMSTQVTSTSLYL